MEDRDNAAIGRSNALSSALNDRFIEYSELPFIGTRDGSDSVKWMSYGDIHLKALQLACNLASICGEASTEIVAIYATNCVEWLVTDFACCLSNYISVGIHHKWNPSTRDYVLNRSEVTVLVCSQSQLDSLSLSYRKSLKLILLIGNTLPENCTENVRLFNDMLVGTAVGLKTRTGATIDRLSVFSLESFPSCNDSRNNENLYTLMYTSGTTGRPKGVCVTTKRWLQDSQVNGFTGQDNPTVVSYMSLAHGGDRGICWQACFAGACIGLSAAKDSVTLLQDFSIFRPTFLLCMSHQWADFYSQFLEELEGRTLAAISEMLARWPIECVPKTEIEDRDRESSILCSNNSTVSVQNQIFALLRRSGEETADGIRQLRDQYPKWQEFIDATATLLGVKNLLLLDWFDKFGGRLFIPVTGGGFTSEAVMQWLNDVFVPATSTGKHQSSRVKNAYGCSEFSGISVNGVVNSNVIVDLVPIPEYDSIGSDGRTISRGSRYDPSRRYSRNGKEGCYAGEIRVRPRGWDSQQTLRYWRDDESTESSCRDGWYYTGDVGELNPSAPDEDGHPTLRVIDRVTSMVEMYSEGDSVWVPRSELEVVFGASPLVHHLCLVADRNEDCLVAIVSPSSDAVSEGQLINEFQRVARQFSESPDGRPLMAIEIPQLVVLDPEPWTVSNEKLTLTGKPRRDRLREQFQGEIEDQYSKRARNTASLRNVQNECSDKSLKEPYQTCRISFPAVLEFSVDLPESLAIILEHLANHVGPKKFQHLPKEDLGWGGYLRQDEYNLPCYPNSSRKDYIGFSFSSVDSEDSHRLNEVLDHMKTQVLQRRESYHNWTLEAQHETMGYADRARTTVKAFKDAIQHEVDSLLLSERLHSRISCDDLNPLFALLSQRLAMVKRLHVLGARVCGPAEKLAFQQAYQRSSEMLRVLAPRMGVRIPAAIDLGSWLAAKDNSDELVKSALMESTNDSLCTQSLGDAKVYCLVSGELIENDEQSTGAPRWHCLDATGADHSVECHDLVVSITKLMKKLVADGVEGAKNVAHRLSLCKPFNPSELSWQAWLSGDACAWSLEYAHFWHLRDRIEHQLVRKYGEYGEFVSIDTPASFIANAMKQFHGRPALGIFSAQVPAIVECLQLHLTKIDGFFWLSYEHLNELAQRTACIIRKLVAPGGFVGICYPNSIEWAVCDIACALAGVVSVGLHSTFDVASAAHAFEKTNIQLLFCDHEHLLCHNSWSVVSIANGSETANSLTSLKTVILLDRIPGQMQGLPPQISLESLPSLLERSLRSAEKLELEDPLQLPRGGRDAPFTILFTSGSSGRPKGVVVSAAGFFNDCCSRNYVEPLVTVSYIPLSHSSDRLKMWEFLGNGGRVGFVYYDPVNWIDHETTKKTSSVQSAAGGSNDVEKLFAQVSILRPTAMACPPNIWNGVYYLYLKMLTECRNTSSIEKEQEAKKYIRSLFGDRIKFLVTGGGPTSSKVKSFVLSTFSNAKFADSYGTTECGAISSNGHPIREKRVSVRLGPAHGVVSADCGEMLVSSPNMSCGYWNDPEETSKCYTQERSDSGEITTWYHTGDLVRVSNTSNYRMIDGKQFWDPVITVMGRISSSTKLKGTDVLVSPDTLEEIYATSPILKQMLIYGHSECPYLVAIVVESAELTRAADQLNQLGISDGEIVQSEILAIALNEMLLRPQDIPREIYMETKPWTTANGLVNESFKKQRGKLLQHYSSVLSTLTQS